jgi:hypothetical protein
MPARMLVVIDVSGSMADPVPTAGDATREQITVESARRGIAMCDDDCKVGLWTFSTELDGDRDYRELVPIEALSTNRDELAGALDAVVPKEDGMTGLHDTIAAAYARLQEGWDPSRVNTLVVMTDGKNQDPAGPTLDGLVAQIQQISNEKKPIQIVILGMGADVNEAELRQIAEPSGGGVFLAPDPSRIQEIFVQMMTLRTVS